MSADVDLVVFDMAGTTVRDEGGGVSRCLREALAAEGVEAAPAAVDAVMGLPKPEALARLVATSSRAEALAPRIGALHADFRRRMLDHYENAPDVGEIPGSAAAFARLRAGGVRVALDTGFDRGIAGAVLARLGWAVGPTLDAWIASDEVARGRPHPDMIRALMQRLDLAEPGRVAKVGDTPADLEEGTRAGCGLVVGVCSGSHTAVQLAACPHTHLVACAADVPALVGL